MAPACGYTFDQVECQESGEHFCVPRADRACAFIEEVCVHTKSVYARRRFRLEDWQRDGIIRPLFGEVRYDGQWRQYVRRYTIAYVCLGRGNGKALALDTPIPTPDGWKMQGQLRVGDEVFGADGNVARVIGTTNTMANRPCYRVTMADGEEITADESHLWRVRGMHGIVSLKTSGELFKTYLKGARQDRTYSIELTQPLRLPTASLPIDPYVLGAWLGDGSTHKAEITCADPEIVDEIRAAGEFVRRYPTTKSPHAWSISEGRGAKSSEPFIVRLRSLGVLGRKYIPQSYLRASAEQRLALLQGLMDTDGDITVRGDGRITQCVYNTCDRRLADNVLELLRSLGVRVAISEGRAKIYGRDVGPKYRLCFTVNLDLPVFRLPRKLDRMRPVPKTPLAHARARYRQIASVEPVESVPVRCIQVDAPDGMYLAGRGFTPTHNSELAAAIVLLLLVGDDEESAEIYGAAKDSKQAGKVGEVVRRMYELSPVLRKRLLYNRQSRRLIDPQTNSYYEVITADAKGELGHNASGAVIDELLTQASDEMWSTLRTAQGKRPQSMLLGFTTASNDPSGFLAAMHSEMVRVEDDPARAPHIFTYIRVTPPEQDPWNEAGWYHANPGLGRFLSVETLRQEAVEAQNDPSKENAFRQFRLNQFVQQATRFIPLHLWDACQGEVMLRPDWMVERLRGSVAYAGLDLSAKFDLTAWCLVVPSAERLWALWRFWLPEAAVGEVDARLGGRLRPWIREGWLVPTEGETIDYEAIYAQIAHDASVFHLRSLDYDPWSGEAVMQEVRRRTRLREDQTIPIPQTYAGMTGPMTELMSALKEGTLAHGGNPVARWNADSVEVKSPADNPDLVRPVKPQRGASGKRVDGVVALALALGGWKRATARSYDVLESVM